jgi:integrase
MKKGTSDRDSAANSLSEKEVSLFENAVSTDKQAFVYMALGKFGFRIGEMAHISHDWFIIEPGNECIKIPRLTKCVHECPKCKKRGGMWSPKTINGARVVPAYIDIDSFWFMEQYLRNGGIPPMERRAREIIYQIEKKANIPHNIFPHALRATAAQRVAAMPNITSPDLMEIFGWADLDTANSYIVASGTNVMRKFTGRDIIASPNAIIKNFKDGDKEVQYRMFQDAPTSSFKCTVCDSDIIVESDGTWHCRECGANSVVDF